MLSFLKRTPPTESAAAPVPAPEPARTPPAGRVYLKIKVTSLAAEARLIRAEERRWPGQSVVRTGLHQHRVLDVRRESRSACLAYGFLRGRAYRVLEATSFTEPDWKRVQTLVEKYAGGDPRDIRQRFAEWKDTGTAKTAA